jgi:hypothetical protein
MSVLRISRGYSLSRHSILCVGKLNPRFKNNGGSYMKKLSAFGLVVGATLMCAAPVSFHWSPAQTPSLSVDKANAVIGRPLTPGSVAGVNRRMHRRAYRHGYYHY